MRNLVVCVFVLYLCQNAISFCCFRDPYILPNTPCTNSTNPCGNSCANATNTCNACNCGAPCRCFRDPDNVCKFYDPTSKVCERFCACDCNGPKYPIYFPEVEYPVAIMGCEPYYCRTCFCA